MTESFTGQRSDVKKVLTGLPFCMCSGVLGIFLNVTAIRLQESDVLPSGLDFSGVQGIARVSCVCVCVCVCVCACD